MQSFPLPLHPSLMVPVELKPFVPGLTLPPLVSIETPMPLSTLPLEMVQLLTSELLELTVTRAARVWGGWDLGIGGGGGGQGRRKGGSRSGAKHQTVLDQHEPL